MKEIIQKYNKQVVLVLLFLTVCVIWYFALSAHTVDRKLTVAFLNVGQGDSIFIESPTGTQILIDGGINDGVLRELGKQMDFSDRYIDMVMATHPDMDHIGGLVGVIERFDIGSYVESDVSHDSAVYDVLHSVVESKNMTPHLVSRGEKYDLGGGVILDILFPDRSVKEVESNMTSIVARLTYGETSFLFTGDSPQTIEEYLISLDGEGLDVDVLKLGHHGSKTSTGEDFLSITSPDYSIISAGFDNKYGHPNKEVTDMLDRFDIKYLNTADVGTIVFESDGKDLRLNI